MRQSGQRGFTLLQMSILLTVASLVLVTILPTSQTKLTNNNTSTTRMNSVLTALRNFQTSNGYLPCPANPYLPQGSPLYGIAAPYNSGGITNNCINGTPTSANTATAAYADTTQKIALGMLPVNALNLSNDYAVDGYGRTITYAVDTTATSCWPSTTLPGKITVNDNGTTSTNVLALVSHGADGYGAWLPLISTSGAASRLDTGSTDMYQADNAQVNNGGTGGGLTANGAGQFQPFYKMGPTATFDDMVAYKNPGWSFNTQPALVQKANTPLVITPPANGDYQSPNVLTFTLAYNQNETVTGTPRLDLAAISGGGSIGTGNVAYANYVSGSGTNTLTFTYTVQAGDLATSGLSMTPTIDLNGGSITPNPCNINFTAPDLSRVIIGQVIYATDSQNDRVEMFSLSGKYIKQFPCASGACTPSGSAGQLGGVWGIAVDPSGNVWVTDYYSHVTKFDLNGNYLNVQFTPAHAPNIGYLQGIGIDSSGNIWVGNNQSSIDEYSTNGTYIATLCNNTYVNNSGVSCSSGSGNGYFGSSVWGIKFDAGDHLWIADSANARVQEFNTALNGRAFMQNVTSTSPSFYTPSTLALDAGQDIWVTDANGGNGFVREFSNSGTQGSVYGNSYGQAAYINNPFGAMFDPSGNLWISDRIFHNIAKINPATGALVATIGSAGTGDGQFSSNNANFVALATKPALAPTLYLADSGNYRIRAINLATNVITTVAGNGSSTDSGDGGPATSAGFANPYGVAVDTSGNIYIADQYRIRKVNSAGIISTIAGTGSSGNTGDGGPATSATFKFAFSVNLDSASNIYVADIGNSNIRKITAAGTISTVAGTGTSGYNGDGILATSAQLNSPYGVTVDSANNLYIADTSNNRIRKVDHTTQYITTIAGNGTGAYAGNGGTPTSAELKLPASVYLDAAGNIYISDMGNSSLRKITIATNTISTIAGVGGSGYSNYGAPTSCIFNFITQYLPDGAGNFYIDDTGNSDIREISAANVVSTYVGTFNSQGFSGDGGPAASAQTHSVWQAAISSR